MELRGKIEDVIARLERERDELRRALENGDVGDPITAIFTIATLKAIAVSAAVSVGSFLMTRAFAPKPPPTERGRQSGDLLIQNSEQGVFIPEIYGGDPAPEVWVASTAYTLNDAIYPVTRNGHYYLVTTAGTTGDTQPTWPTTSGGTVTNGTVTFTEAGRDGGGVRLPPQIVWTSGIRKNVTVSRQETGGGKGGGGGGRTQEVQDISYDVDLLLQWGRGVLDHLAIWANTDLILDQRPKALITDIIDIEIDSDDDYNQLIPPNPQINYTRPVARAQGALTTDGQNVRTGNILHGAYASIALYPGNSTQLPDPTVEAALTAALGANSTPAYRGRAGTKLAAFSLSRWGGILPNFTAALQHATARSFSSIYASMSARTDLAGGDYDFSALATKFCRGLLLVGRRYEPREVMEATARIYNIYFTENVDGLIVGRDQDEVSVLTIADTELGWMDNDPDSDQPLPELDSNLANEIDLPRRIDVKFFDPDKDFEPNLQTAVRQVTDGEDEQTLDMQLTMYADEAREVAQRELYQEYVEGTKHRFQLSWEYLYLQPGNIITITRGEGFTHSLRLTAITGGISLLDCEAIAVDTALFTQPVSTSGGDYFEQPPVPIPAMSILALMDTPLLRDKDATENNGTGFYFAATPRTGTDQAWLGASLYVDKVGWERIADTTLPATMGRVVSFADLVTSDPETLDTTGEFVVDLYGTTATLESALLADVLLGANAALVGNSVIQWTTATRVSGFPNRWKAEDLLHGKRDTENYAATHTVNERFVLLNEAVQFVPIAFSDLNTERNYKAVTAGQSLDDAATVTFAWTGRSLMYPLVENLNGIVDEGENWQFAWDRAGTNELEDYRVDIMSLNGLTLKRRMPVGSLILNRALLNVTPGFNPFGIGGKGGGGFISNELIGFGSSLEGGQGAFGYFINPLDDDPCGIAATYSTVTTPASQYIPPARLAFTDAAEVDYQIRITPWTADGAAGLQVFVNDVEVFSDTDGEVSGTRYTIKVTTTQVRFYRNYTGDGSEPFYVSPKPATFPLQPYVSAGDQQLWKAIEYEDQRETVDYPANLQTFDFGSTQSSLRVRVYRVRTLQGIEINGDVREVIF